VLAKRDFIFLLQRDPYLQSGLLSSYLNL